LSEKKQGFCVIAMQVFFDIFGVVQVMEEEISKLSSGTEDVVSVKQYSFLQIQFCVDLRQARILRFRQGTLKLLTNRH